MKKLVYSLLAITAASFTIISCKKESVSENAKAATDPAPNASLRGGGTLPTPKTYILTRRGKDSLTYYNDGRLAKVQHTANTFTQYNYGFNTIIAKKWVGNQLDEETTYQLDVQTGKAFEAKWTGYTYYSAGTVVTSKTWKFTYNADGRIKLKYNKNVPNERYEFVYQNDNIYTIHTYTSNNKNPFHTAYQTVGFKLNKLKLNPEWSTLDPYLDIFGTPAKYMYEGQSIWSTDSQKWLSAEKHTYSYNADNYPTQFVREDLMGYASTKTVLFSYIVK